MTDRRDDIAITGTGLVCALGLDGPAAWRALEERRAGLGPLRAIEQPLSPNKGGGEAPFDDAAPGPRTAPPREVRGLRLAIGEALAEAGLDAERWPFDPPRCGAVLGTTLAGMRAAGAYLRSGRTGDMRGFLAVETLQAALAGLPVGGPALTTCTACASGLTSVALARTLLQLGQLDLVIAGGYDPLSEYAYAGFDSLRLVATAPLAPFSAAREGMKLGEGWGIVILERALEAVRRGATPIACVAGCGESSDGHHLTQPHPDGDGAARAMRAALRDASIAPSDIDLICAHATATPANDAAEHRGYRTVFGDRLPEIGITALKSHIGHTLGGAGGAELVLATYALRRQAVPPTAGTTPQDVEFPDLRLVDGAPRPAAMNHSLNLSMGFGGANACVVLRHRGERPAAADDPGPDARVPVITGAGFLAPGCIGRTALATRLSDGAAVAAIESEPPLDAAAIAHLVNARRVRRVSLFAQLMLAAAADACDDAGIDDPAAFAAEASAILGSTHGASDYSERYYRQIVEEGIGAANPMLFAEGVPNVASAHLSLALQLKGGAQTIVGSRTAGLDALHLAAARVRAGAGERFFVGAAEESTPLMREAYRRCGLAADGPPSPPFGDGRGYACGSGAVVLVVESHRAAAARGAIVRATVDWSAAARGETGDPAALAAALATMLRDRLAPAVVASANGSAIDAIEASALERTAAGDGRPTTVGSLAGHFGEAYSVTPLAGVAAVVTTGRVPRLAGAGALPAPLVAAGGDETPREVTCLAVDRSGTATALGLTLGPPAA